MPRRGAHRTRAPLVASGVPPDVEGGILPPGRKAWTFLRVVEFLSGCGRKGFFPPGKMHGSTAGRRPAATGAVPGRSAGFQFGLLLSHWPIRAGLDRRSISEIYPGKGAISQNLAASWH